MRLSSIFAAALLPLAAMAEDDSTYSTTSTSTMTMTKYITLERASTATGAPWGSNGTATYMPTGTGGVYPTPTASPSNGDSGSGAPAATSSVPPPSAGVALNGANVALAAVAGVVVAALM